MAHAGHVLEMRTLPHVPGKFKTVVKGTKVPKGERYERRGLHWMSIHQPNIMVYDYIYIYVYVYGI